MLWPICFKKLDNIQGFKYVTTLKFVEGGAYMHRDWELLMVFCIGTADYMLQIYVDYAELHNMEASAENLLS